MGQGRHGGQGEGADRAGVCLLSRRAGSLHLSSPGAAAGIDRQAAGVKGDRHCVRDGARHQGTLPLLTPMSEVAGRMSVQVGASYLEKEKGGRGILLGGVPGVPPARVCIIGGGVVGTQRSEDRAGVWCNRDAGGREPEPAA